MKGKIMPKKDEGVHIEYVALDELRRWPRNPKEHDLGAIHTSIDRFGFVAPLIVDEGTGQLVAGHGRLDALLQLRDQGGPPPDRIKAKGKTWSVPVVRGITFPDPHDAAAYLVADNRLTEVGGWITKNLAAMLSEIAEFDDTLLEASGFDGDDLDRLLKECGEIDSLDLGEQEGPGRGNVAIMIHVPDRVWFERENDIRSALDEIAGVNNGIEIKVKS